jgi:hypothetical protein
MKWLMIFFLVTFFSGCLKASEREFLINKAISIRKLDSKQQKMRNKRYVQIIYDQWYKNRHKLKHIKTAKMPIALAMSESGLNPKAVSKSKCLGILQLDPKTALYICKKYKIKYNKNIKTQLLNDVYFNTLVGLYTLNEELGAANDNHRDGILAYKCGRANVSNRLFVPTRYMVLYSRYQKIYNGLS